jgi:hypothetical protein
MEQGDERQRGRCDRMEQERSHEERESDEQDRGEARQRVEVLPPRRAV